MFGLGLIHVGFLAAATAVSVPILIHLLLKPRARPMDIGTLRFLGVEMAATRIDLTDRPDFAEGQRVAAPLLEAFLSGDVDRVDVVFGDFQSIK